MLTHYNDYPPADLQEAVDRTVAALRGHRGEFDTIAVRGVSGMIVGAPAALALGVPLVAVRKPGESSHSGGRPANGSRAGSSYVIVDDFTCTGATLAATREGMRATGARFAGAYLYRNDQWFPADYLYRVNRIL